MVRLSIMTVVFRYVAMSNKTARVGCWSVAALFSILVLLTALRNRCEGAFVFKAGRIIVGM